ncbi:MAG: N-6 DNA methylase, partial [Deltaproteobacteria bacterium]|nr:N-6 DNA methylase [Deltaproteobacteria bacterium]
SNIDLASHAEQIGKYLSTGQRVILTDGLEFIFYEANGGASPKRHCLIEKPVLRQVSGEPRIDYLLDARFRDFFRESGFRHCSEDQLIREMAVRAAALAECVLSLSKAPSGSGVSDEENNTIEILHELQTTLLLHHDPVLKHPSVFASFVAQVLCFGLLYAHRVIAVEAGEPPERYNAIRRFWSDAVYSSYADRLAPFKSLVAMLESELSPSEETTSQLRCWYDDARRLLAHVQLRDKQRSAPDFHTLYERFLTEFDPQTRFDFGAFYTPPELASFAVGSAKAVIESVFSGRRLFEEGNKIIDPCCGTGTFLEQLVKHSIDEQPTQLIGFEILPAPYALAHYRMVMLDVENAPNHDVDVILTNTLSDELLNEDDEHPRSVLGEELLRARECAAPPIVMVIGNPPSSDSFGPHSTGSNFGIIDRLLEDFRPPESERRARQNTQKQIGNDFMKFLRWAADKVLASEIGALALVVPSSFAVHPSYRHAREWLVARFGEFWVMDIDRDLRTGARSSSLFDTQQGRMLLIATHTGEVQSTHHRRLNYIAITDQTRAQKKLFLGRERTNDEILSLFSQYDLDEQTSAFRPIQASFDRALYSRFWAIHSEGSAGPVADERCVFARHCSGIKLAPTALFVHPDKPILKRRSLEIADLSKSYLEIKGTWYTGQRKPPSESKFSNEVRRSLGEAARRDDSYQTYAFRPFLPMNLLLDNKTMRALASLGGGGTRMRPEVVSAFGQADTVGIAIAPSPIDIGQDLHRFATFCWDMPDNDLCSRGNSHVFCSQFPEYKTTGRQEWNPTPEDNINNELLSVIREIRPETSSRDVVFYVYAVLCSGTLLEAFADAYFTASSSENIPRIPIVRNPGIMTTLIEFGTGMAELENPSNAVQLCRWVADLEGMYERPFKLLKFAVDDDNCEVRLFSDQRDPEILLDGIPRDLLMMTVSGYEVLACWLKFHSHPYTRRDFSQDEFRGFLGLLSCLDAQIALTQDIDSVLEGVLSGQVDIL